VLHYLTKVVKSFTAESTEVFADLPKFRINGTTIPADILVTGGEGSKPDLVLINREEKRILLMELSCSLPRNTKKANTTKFLKYTNLAVALRDSGYQTYILPFEVGSNGHISKESRNKISLELKKFKVKLKSKEYSNMAKISLLCTMSIFYAYQTKDWTSPPFLHP
jgi:hypothetical protein